MPSSPVSFKSPLPPEDLRFEAVTATQGVSALDTIELELLSARPDIAAEKLLGQPVGVAIALGAGGQRHLNGLVTRLGIGRAQGRWFRYHASVRPWLWALTRTADCRIFQDQNVRQIIETVFADHAAIADFRFKLHKSYRTRTYCVQYRETDFDFVARLCEEEGIYWYFEHGAGGAQQLVLVDDVAALEPAPGAESLPYYDNRGQRAPDVATIGDWSASREVRTGKAALTSYDFERPGTTLRVEQVQPRSHTLDDAEVFDFEGRYTRKDDGQHLVDTRLEELQCGFERLAGTTTSHALQVGHLFRLTNHPRADQNAQYLCLHSRLSLRLAPSESVGGAGTDGGDHFECSFAAQPSQQPYRAPRRTPRPFVQGPQTAVVAGPAGEEIYTDKYGRVKVQFHWDRYGKRNDQSSCWVRVSSPWAGKSFGFVQIPRIGQEVVVSFLEGDPDQPLVTGRVYNAEQMPPWELPSNATQSGVLTRSSKGGAYGNANAIRFEDRKGAEQLWIHAEKNQDIEVENDETHSVGHDRSKTVDHDETVLVKHDRTETVGNNETITIGANRTEKVGVDETITIGASRREQVGANETLTIGANRSVTVGASETVTVALQRTHSVGINETIAIGAAQEVAIGAAQTVTVGAMQAISVGANQSTEVGANQSTSVAANQSTSVAADRSVQVGGAQGLQVGKGRSTSVAEGDTLTVGKALVIDAGDAVTIKTGSASITMKKDGTIVIKGKDITLEGSGKISIRASSDVVVKGSKILQN